MKTIYFIIGFILVTFLSFAAFAHHDEAPAYMKDGTITVTLKDGKSYTFSTNTHKVVLRGVHNDSEEESDDTQEESTVVREETKKISNTVILHGGIGNTDLETRRYGSNADVIQQRGMVGGVTLCRSRDNKGACVSGFSNNTITLGLKLDFE